MKSKTESIYYAADGSYIVESNNCWLVGEKRYDGEVVTRIEPYDYEKNYDEN